MQLARPHHPRCVGCNCTAESSAISRAAAHPKRPPSAAAAETQKAPGKPFMRLETAAGPVVLGFGSVEERDQAVELLVAAKPAAAAGQAAGPAPAGGSGRAAAAGGPAAELKKQLFDADP